MAKPTRSRMTGDFPAGARTARRAAPRPRSGCATARAATTSATGPRPRPPTAPNAGCSARPTPPNITRDWNYFAGLTAEEAARRAAEEESGASAFRKSAHYQWAGSGDGSRSRDEMRASKRSSSIADADFGDDQGRPIAGSPSNITPTSTGDDAEAAKRFQQVQAAYEVLRKADERRGRTDLGSTG